MHLMPQKLGSWFSLHGKSQVQHSVRAGDIRIVVKPHDPYRLQGCFIKQPPQHRVFIEDLFGIKLFNLLYEAAPSHKALLDR